MATAATVLTTAAGVALVLVTSRDIFSSLFHPEARAVLSRFEMRGVWWLFRRISRGRPRMFSLAGPAALVGVIVTWAASMAVGWTLIYLPHMPEQFRVAPGAPLNEDFVESLHFSLVTLTTVGFGDVAPQAAWLRIAAPVEALLGFGLLSAAISWFLLLYPVLSRRRSLAYEISLLLAAERDTGVRVERLEADAAERMYAELTSRLVAVERDLVSFPAAYYFAERDPRFSLAAVAPKLLPLAERGVADDMAPTVQLRAGMLLGAIDDFAGATAERFHGSSASRRCRTARVPCRTPSTTSSHGGQPMSSAGPPRPARACGRSGGCSIADPDAAMGPAAADGRYAANSVRAGARSPRSASMSTSMQPMPRASASTRACGFMCWAASTPRQLPKPGVRRIRSR